MAFSDMIREQLNQVMESETSKDEETYESQGEEGEETEEEDTTDRYYELFSNLVSNAEK